MDETQINELTHHGITGMKWGVRRYQNKDGSLTSAGKRRRTVGETVKDYRVSRKRKASLKKARETKAANKIAAEQRAKDIKSGKIKAKNMTDAELKARIERLNLEKTYNDAVKNSKQAEAGKRFTSKYKESVIDKLADNVSADLTAQLIKAFGAKGINKLVGEEVTFANNKKKS